MFQRVAASYKNTSTWSYAKSTYKINIRYDSDMKNVCMFL